MITEQEILEACLAKLRALDPVKRVDLKKEHNRVPRGEDGQLILHTEADQFIFLYECKRALNLPGLEHVLLQLTHYTKKTKAKLLILSDYFPPRLAERLIQEGINFVDAAGNVYVHWSPKLHIQIQGMRPKQLWESKTERLSQPSGLQLIYALITQGPRTLGSYRELARAAGVALGSVAWVVRELKAKGYLVQRGRKDWRLTRKGKLLDLWVGGYAGRLRRKLVIGRYWPPEEDRRATMTHLQKELADGKIHWALTGGFAADELTRHYRGNELSFFVQDWPSDLSRRLMWLPSPEGPVTVLRQFSPLVVFDLERSSTFSVAHPLLVYSELVFQGRERELETAKILYERYLTSFVHNDGS